MTKASMEWPTSFSVNLTATDPTMLPAAKAHPKISLRAAKSAAGAARGNGRLPSAGWKQRLPAPQVHPF